MSWINEFIAGLNWLVIIVSIVGNVLVIVVVKNTRPMRTTTNFLLVNLAVADIVTNLFNRLLHESIWPPRLNNDFLCKFLIGNGFIGLPITVSVLTLVVLAVERYHALVKPMATRLRLTNENFHYAIIATWCMAVTMNIPIIIDYRLEDKFCKGVWGLDFSDWTSRYITFYSSMAISSAVLVGYCYFQIFRGLYITNTICPESTSTEQDRKSKKKLAKTLVLVTAFFYVAVVPFHIFMLYMVFKRKQEYIDGVVFEVLAFLTTANSCVNPIVYAFQSDNYKSGFKRIFRCGTVSNEDDQGHQPIDEHSV